MAPSLHTLKMPHLRQTSCCRMFVSLWGSLCGSRCPQSSHWTQELDHGTACRGKYGAFCKRTEQASPEMMPRGRYAPVASRGTGWRCLLKIPDQEGLESGEAIEYRHGSPPL